MVPAAGIARIAGVRVAAVGQWRRRHDDFPAPASGAGTHPRYALDAVEDWLRGHGKSTGIPAGERLWLALETARETVPAPDTLAAASLLLYGASVSGTVPAAGGTAALRLARDTGAGALARVLPRGTGTASGLRVPSLPEDDEAMVLHAAAGAAAADGPASALEALCARFFGAGQDGRTRPTRPGLAALMLDLAGTGPGQRLLDPACGGGEILLAAAARGHAAVDGQELDSSLALVSAVRLAMAGAGSFSLRAGDSLRADAFAGGQADAVVCSPPFGDRDWGVRELAGGPRWEYGPPQQAEPELAWVQHALAHVAPGGPVVIVMPPAAAVRPSGRRIRASLVRRGALRAVISLPPGLAARYSVALQIWVLARPEQERPGEHVLLVDVSAADTRTPCAWHDASAAAVGAWEAFRRGHQPPAPDCAAVVPASALLGGNTDLTPRRHLQSPRSAAPARAPEERRAGLSAALTALARQIPEPPAAGGAAGRDARVVLLGELEKAGAAAIRRAPRVSRGDACTTARILTARDVALDTPPSGRGNAIADEFRNPVIREGDVLVVLTGPQFAARAAVTADAGARLSPGTCLIRPDRQVIDPGFLAGVLSGATAARQAAAGAGTEGRFDPRQVQVPLLPAAAQRAAAEEFRRLRDFAAALRDAHDEGAGLIRDLFDIAARQQPPGDRTGPEMQ